MALSHLLDTLRPRLLTEAAHGGLKPSPTERLRRVLLHLSYSMALSHLLDTIPPRFFSLDHWWEVLSLHRRVGCERLKAVDYRARARGGYARFVNTNQSISSFTASARLISAR